VVASYFPPQLNEMLFQQLAHNTPQANNAGAPSLPASSIFTLIQNAGFVPIGVRDLRCS
jgi:hypothetical protein